MPKLIVTYFSVDEIEKQCVVKADDEAAALGLVLDELGEDIADDSPFCIWRQPGRSRGAARIVSGPEPYEDEDDELPDTRPAVKLATEQAAKPPEAVAAPIDEIASRAGAKVDKAS